MAGRHDNPFTAELTAQLLHLRDVEGLSFPEIDKRLGRKPKSSAIKYAMLKGPQNPRKAVGERVQADNRPAPQLIADAQARARLQHPTITAAFFGDPLPGRSALDQRRGV